MTLRLAAGVATIVGAAITAAARPPVNAQIRTGPGQISTPPARPAVSPLVAIQQRTAILALEDAREASDLKVSALIATLDLQDPETQRILVRALGRLERPSLLPRLTPYLSSRTPAVRAEAANAIAQAFHHPDPSVTSAARIASMLLLQALRLERTDTVAGVIARSLARLPYGKPAEIKEVESALVRLAKPPDRQASPTLTFDMMVALETLIRLQRSIQPPSADAIRVLRSIATSHVGDPRPRVPAMAALMTAGVVDFELVDSALSDPSPDVRRLAVVALRSAGTDLSEVSRQSLVMRTLNDRAAPVRWEALQAYGMRPSLGCQPIADALSDSSDHVVLLALDLLGGSCVPGTVNVPDVLAGYTRDVPSSRGWQRAAHALVAMAVRDPERAGDAMPAFATHELGQVRRYAAQAAAILRDVERLKIFAVDDDDNVRQLAVTWLRAQTGHESDDLYIDNLRRPDYQLLITVARVLEGAPNRERAAAALFDALARVTEDQRETSHEARLALLARIGELATPRDAQRLDPYVTDFDAEVAAEAARLITRWTDRKVSASPRVLPLVAPPTVPELSLLDNKVARVTTRGLGAFRLRLLMDQAPLTVVRFARLVASKYYDGLTFHRVTPNFLAQGGSPGGNDYAGGDRYFRDEVGLPHLRGAVGMSTHGRDTGDGQFFIDLVDNLHLAHDYTVFGTIVPEDLRLVDSILEGDTIDRIEILADAETRR
jgi:cyclophilin family peptidyl-prolyl cis-trans isomerase/HEAT repeat protein